MLKTWLGLALISLAGCGGSAHTTTANGNAGSSNSGAAGSARAGSDDQTGSGGTSGAASPVAGRGGAAGIGGKVPDVAGSAGEGPLACSAPYAGPSAGPHSDGPPDLGSCASIADQVVLARYDDRSARVPKGLYYEPNESITFWKPPCSKSIEDTVARGATGAEGTFMDSFENDWFYEAAYCLNGSLRRTERNLRCDYFDGERLADATPERLAFLASMLWWADHSNLEGSQILGHSIVSGNSIDVVELCTVSTVYGDFGLCDEVQLESTTYRSAVGGTVEFGKTEVLRTLKGNCR